MQNNVRRRRGQGRLSAPNRREDPQDNSDTNPRTGSVVGVQSPVFFASEQIDENISIDRTEVMPERITSYRKAELLMHYMDYVFPLQFRFHTPDVNGRGWLLWLLIKTGPLYHAALSLSALHQSIYFPNVFGNAYAELDGYHAKALRDLQKFLQHLRISDDRDEKSRLIEVMSCGVSLISFELFQGGVSDWQLHLDALISILTSRSSHAIIQLLTETGQNPWSQNAPRDWQHTALSFLITTIMWFDLLACASTGKAPRMPYKVLLDKNIVDMSIYMGAQNWVMRAIGDIAALDKWKNNAQDDSAPDPSDLVSRGRIIERQLERGLQSLDYFDLETHSLTTADPLKKANTIKNVTRSFATAALVYLHVVLFELEEDSDKMQDAVARNVASMKRITDQQDMRGLVWPICISGSMAGTPHQPFYEAIVKETLGDSPRDFGNCTTILKILTRSWEIRRLGKNHPVRWRHAMTEIGLCLLV
ncbi:hypothetical protein PISL3812_00046 [Talaromyces islandicus]|uniref:Uncharacterized protein n=1 Tax=Talaromyces islandicus TaxID=28573 RepID=A0A0U1LIS1_TALIS|nr:hypothetical protein PISL3812_00046 [Talaromyces islandicus]